MSLSRPEFGSLAMWLPLVFAAMVFIGAFLIGQWGAAIAGSASFQNGPPRLGGLARPVPYDAAQDDPEPIRVGTVLPAQSDACATPHTEPR
jgi:hypothetical protein